MLRSGPRVCSQSGQRSWVAEQEVSDTGEGAGSGFRAADNEDGRIFADFLKFQAFRGIERLLCVHHTFNKSVQLSGLLSGVEAYKSGRGACRLSRFFTWFSTKL
jgi:hypothetical protein